MNCSQITRFRSVCVFHKKAKLTDYSLIGVPWLKRELFYAISAQYLFHSGSHLNLFAITYLRVQMNGPV